MKEVESISKWVEHRLIRGYYTFTLEDVKKEYTSFSDSYIKTAIGRLSKSGKIISPTKGFYVIVPVEYALSGLVPATFYIDNMMDYLSRDYYIALLNAAGFYGAAHQRPQTFMVIHNGSPIRDAVRAGIRFQFINNKAIDARFIRQQKSKLGTINVASPELTAIDLVEHQSKVGGLNRVGTVLDELAENFDLSSMPDDFFAIYPVPVYQRLGYILDEVVDASEQADILYTRLTRLKKPMRATPLKNGKSTSDCELNRKWNVYVNHEIEIDE